MLLEAPGGSYSSPLTPSVMQAAVEVLLKMSMKLGTATREQH